MIGLRRAFIKMYKYILIVYDKERLQPKDVYYSYDSISEMLQTWGCDNLIQLKNKYQCIICECVSLF